MIQNTSHGIHDIFFPLRIFIQSVVYTIRGIIEKPMRWVLFSIATLLLGIPLILYVRQILQGADPALEELDALFSGGVILKAAVIIIAIIVGVLATSLLIMLGALVMIALSLYPGIGLLLLGIAFFLPVAIIRFARSSIGWLEAHSIIGDIGKIGWARYSLSMGLLMVVSSVVMYGLLFLELVFFFLMIIGRDNEPLYILGIATLFHALIIPLIAVFTARYVTLLYDSDVQEKPS